jgi:hypothetical protein
MEVWEFCFYLFYLCGVCEAEGVETGDAGADGFHLDYQLYLIMGLVCEALVENDIR